VRSLGRELPRLVALVLVLQLFFLLLLAVGAMVPDRPIVEHLATDVRTGSYGPSGEPDGQGGRATTFTDCVAAGTGLGRPDLSVVQRAVRMPRLGSCTLGARQLQALARGRAPTHHLEYFRYWAGYSVLSRPVLAAAGMDGMRVVAGGLFVVGLLAMVLAVSRAVGTGYAWALTVPLLVSTNVLTVPATAFSHALSLAVIFGGVAAVAWASRLPGWRVLYAVVAGAAVFNFVDLLTTPAMPWALTAAVAASATYVRTRLVKDAFWTGVVTSGAWFAAYAATWASRWLIAIVFLGRDHVMGVVVGTARFRIDGDNASVDHRFGAAVLRNVRTWLAVPVTPSLVLGVSVVVAVAALALAWRRHARTGLLAALVLTAPALIAPAWMLVLSNHSQIHDVFVYRTVPTSVGIGLAACLLAASRAVRVPGSAHRVRAHTGEGAGRDSCS
jgi:hypothetical protein